MGPASTTRTLALMAAFAVAAVVSMGVLAPSEARAGDEATIIVRTIHAAPGDKVVDEKLGDIEVRLTKAFRDYDSFKELARHNVTLPATKTYDFALPDDHKLTVHFLGISDGFLRLRLNVDQKFKSDIRVSEGGTVFQAGLPYGKDGMLIIALTVNKGGS